MLSLHTLNFMTKIFKYAKYDTYFKWVKLLFDREEIDTFDHIHPQVQL